jgi:hypothetical protein
MMMYPCFFYSKKLPSSHPPQTQALLRDPAHRAHADAITGQMCRIYPTLRAEVWAVRETDAGKRALAKELERGAGSCVCHFFFFFFFFVRPSTKIYFLTQRGAAQDYAAARGHHVRDVGDRGRCRPAVAGRRRQRRWRGLGRYRDVLVRRSRQ